MKFIQKRVFNLQTGILICILFFFNFCTLSCGGREIAELMGLQLVLGVKADALNVPVQPFAVIALLASIALIVLFFIKLKKENQAFSITGIIGAVSLIALNIHTKIQMSKGALDGVEFDNEAIQLSWTLWYWLCVVLFVVVASVNRMLHKQKTSGSDTCGS